MSQDPKPVTGQEALYDAEIAPALLAIGQRCQELGIPLVAAVEYAPGEVGQTHYMPENACIAMQIAHRGAASRGNFDGVCISLLRYLHRTGIDASASMFLKPPGSQRQQAQGDKP